MQEHHNKIPVYTIVEYFDIETGEIITKSIMERMYIKSKKSEFKETKYENRTNHIAKIIRQGCWKFEQSRLF